VRVYVLTGVALIITATHRLVILHTDLLMYCGHKPKTRSV